MFDECGFYAMKDLGYDVAWRGVSLSYGRRVLVKSGKLQPPGEPTPPLPSFGPSSKTL